jgi:hypothetical protein
MHAARKGFVEKELPPVTASTGILEQTAADGHVPPTLPGQIQLLVTIPRMLKQPVQIGEAVMR